MRSRRRPTTSSTRQSRRAPTPFYIDMPVTFSTPTDTAFLMYFAHSDFLKSSITKIRTNDSLWLTAMAALFSVSVSFGVGATSLWWIDNVPNYFKTASIVITCVAFSVSLMCLPGYLGDRTRNREQINVAVEYLVMCETGKWKADSSD